MTIEEVKKKLEERICSERKGGQAERGTVADYMDDVLQDEGSYDLLLSCAYGFAQCAENWIKWLKENRPDDEERKLKTFVVGFSAQFNCVAKIQAETLEEAREEVENEFDSVDISVASKNVAIEVSQVLET